MNFIIEPTTDILNSTGGKFKVDLVILKDRGAVKANGTVSTCKAKVGIHRPPPSLRHESSHRIAAVHRLETLRG